MRANCVRADEPRRLGRHHRVHRHDVALPRAGRRASASLRGCTGRTRCTFMPRPSSRHFVGAADGAEADDAGGPARELPGAVPLVGDLARRRTPGRRGRRGRRATMKRLVANRSAIVISATASALRPGARSTGMPALVAAGDVDVVRVAAARADDAEVALEYRAFHRIGLDDEDRRAFLVDHASASFSAVVETQRELLDPGVEDDVGDAFERRRAPRRGTARSRTLSVVGHARHPPTAVPTSVRLRDRDDPSHQIDQRCGVSDSTARRCDARSRHHLGRALLRT